MKLDNHDVQEILRLLDASGYNELSIQTDQLSLTLRRSGDGDNGWVKEEASLARPNVLSAPENSPPQVQQQASSDPGQVLGEGLVAVRAPLPGTFYRAPKPGAAPFVEEGAVVESDSVVGIIETMKLMNSVYADLKGTITEIHVQNGQAVEKDTILMTLVPEAS